MKKIFMTLLIAMTPVLELRGSIPAGVAAGLGLSESILISIIGNLIPVPFILIFTRKIFAYLKNKSKFLNKFVVKMEQKAQRKKKNINKYEFFGLVILVAIPFPGTGAWTGAMVAALLNIRLKRAMPAIFLGVLIAAIIVAYITYGAKMLIM